MPLSCILILCVACSAFSEDGHATAKGIAMVKKQYIEFCVSSAPGDQAVRDYMEKLRPDGTWPDIRYRDQNRSGWLTLGHLRRMLF